MTLYNRVSMDFKLFFTKKGKKNEEKYISMLSKQFGIRKISAVKRNNLAFRI